MTTKEKRETARIKYYKDLGREVPPLNKTISKAARARRKAEKATKNPRRAKRNPKELVDKPRSSTIRSAINRIAFVKDAQIYNDSVIRCVATHDWEGVELYAKLTQRALKGKV